MKKTIIKGTGRYAAPRLVTNDDLARVDGHIQRVDCSAHWH